LRDSNSGVKLRGMKGAAGSNSRTKPAKVVQRKPAVKKTGSLEKLLQGLPAAPAHFVEPMKCRLSETLPKTADWVYEIKFDGFRGLAIKNGDTVQLISRNNRELGPKFPGIVSALRKIPCKQLVLDGEIVALDENGRSSFQQLQRAADFGNRSSITYYAFDILNVNGRNLTSLPLMKRKAVLKLLIAGKSDCIRFSDVLEGSIEELSAAMQKMGLEGLIAKKRDSTYEAGARSGSWIKFKWGHEQEFVIGGYTDPEGSRPYFGSVLVGYYDGPKLIFAAKVGTGFNTKLLKSLYDRFQQLRAEKTPFANLPERGGVIGPSQMRACKWVQPKLVCQVRFTEWTGDGHLRQPVFLGLREDKEPGEVVKEVPLRA
jgi:bifunctional non-homologous end joining protein LigD